MIAMHVSLLITGCHIDPRDISQPQQPNRVHNTGSHEDDFAAAITFAR